MSITLFSVAHKFWIAFVKYKFNSKEKGKWIVSAVKMELYSKSEKADLDIYRGFNTLKK